ncbi:MAG: lysophospholipid acyltransferase family protein [Prevotellaceae bacterium]|nr:lysophospholipid acyltransferase family protein [Prevotellaceae bacterium]
MKYLYRIYQLLIVCPFVVILTVLVTVTIAIGTSLGGGHWFSYYPGKWWAYLILKAFLIPVRVEGREYLKKGESYVFVSNHQGAFDIFLIFGHLGRHFKWMMKWQLRKMPFVGYACMKSRQIFVDKRGARKIKETYDKARDILKDGTSVTVFPEGARTFTGHMGVFRRGAFMLADELQLPVVPLTINGSFNILPRTRDGRWVAWHPLKLTIHKPVYPEGRGTENIKRTMEKSYATIMSALVPEYQGFVENPDQ